MSEGKHLVDEGDYAYEFMAIEEGTAEVRRGDEKLAELGPGDFFGEMGLLGARRRNATVIATSPSAPDHARPVGHAAASRRPCPSAAEKIRAAAEARATELDRARAVAGRIVVFGATGYTGRLTAEALVRRGQRPVLAARSAAKLAELAGELGGDLDVAVADVVASRDRDARSWRRATCSWPPWARSRSGAARPPRRPSRSGAHYIDSTGEPPFIRARVRALRAARGDGGHRDAHRVRLRLGARQPGRRARAAGGRRGGHAGGHGLLHHRQRRSAA